MYTCQFWPWCGIINLYNTIGWPWLQSDYQNPLYHCIQHRKSYTNQRQLTCFSTLYIHNIYIIVILHKLVFTINLKLLLQNGHHNYLLYMYILQSYICHNPKHLEPSPPPYTHLLSQFTFFIKKKFEDC